MTKQIVPILSYITFLGWIIALILNVNDKTSAGSFHLRQTLMIWIIFLIPVVGWIAGFIFWIMGLISAIKGEQKTIPLVGDAAQKWFTFL